MQDNSDLAHKLRVRHAALALLPQPPAHVLDLYAGEGVITGILWQHVAQRVTAVEREAAKASRIRGADRIIVGDNRNWLHLAADADLIDCDAYGLVMPLIAKLPPGKLVVFTDGTPEKARKVWNANRQFVADFSQLLERGAYERSAAGNAFYGYGWTR